MAVSLILFVLFVMIYIMISDIITIFFRLTGLTEEKARFQVISLLTNSGFTTRKAETRTALSEHPLFAMDTGFKFL